MILMWSCPDNRYAKILPGLRDILPSPSIRSGNMSLRSGQYFCILPGKTTLLYNYHTKKRNITRDEIEVDIFI